MNVIARGLLQELELEAPSTRKTLERVPEKFDWKPHAKSMSLGRLAQHLSEIPHWTVETRASHWALPRRSQPSAPFLPAPRT